jgi:hypothetical protein
MHRTRANFIAFLRSPGIVSTTFVVILFLQLFSNWSFRPDVFGHMYMAIRLFFWFSVAVGAALLLHFSFDQLTDRLARPTNKPPRKDERAPGAILFRR